MSDEDKVYIKVPTWDGKKKTWPFFKVKMLSYLAQKGLIELLSYKGEIDRDDKTYTNEEKKSAAVKVAMTLKNQNRKAAGVLLSCIDVDTEDGMSAFAVIEEFVNAEEGYAGGHFIKAWNALIKRYEDKDTIDVADLKQTYVEEDRLDLRLAYGSF